MKIVFLDIDGVLNSERSVLAGSHRAKDSSWTEDDPYFMKITKSTIDPVACDLINRIVHEFNAKIVLSSTHRMHFRGPEKLSLIQEYLGFLGISGGSCIGYTERLDTIRGIEIQEWLNRNPTVTHYAIIDDSSDMLPEQMENFILVDGGTGLSAQNYRDVTRLFGREDSGLIFP